MHTCLFDLLCRMIKNRQYICIGETFNRRSERHVSAGAFLTEGLEQFPELIVFDLNIEK